VREERIKFMIIIIIKNATNAPQCIRKHCNIHNTQGTCKKKITYKVFATSALMIGWGVKG
jgi:hypothetical protein